MNQRNMKKKEKRIDNYNREERNKIILEKEQENEQMEKF